MKTDCAAADPDLNRIRAPSLRAGDPPAILVATAPAGSARSAHSSNNSSRTAAATTTGNETTTTSKQLQKTKYVEVLVLNQILCIVNKENTEDFGQNDKILQRHN